MEENNRYERIMELNVVRRFCEWDGEREHVYAYPALIKDGVYYPFEENVNSVNDYSRLRGTYSNPEKADDEWEIPEEITDLDSLADWILDDWSDMIIEDGYKAENYEYVLDFWNENGVFHQKKFYKK
ncbi:MAG: hypothetical protein J1E57_05575 [Prevotella sp.]|nr:hypothetical protein [Prevotella sp.]